MTLSVSLQLLVLILLHIEDRMFENFVNQAELFGAFGVEKSVPFE